MGPLGLPELIIIFIVLVVPLAVAAVILVVVVKAASRTTQASSTKRCPFCAAIIQAEANVCKGCRRDLGDSATSQPR
jgi:hypothetical protein